MAIMPLPVNPWKPSVGARASSFSCTVCSAKPNICDSRGGRFGLDAEVWILRITRRVPVQHPSRRLADLRAIEVDERTHLGRHGFLRRVQNPDRRLLTLSVCFPLRQSVYQSPVAQCRTDDSGWQKLSIPRYSNINPINCNFWIIFVFRINRMSSRVSCFAVN